MVALWLVAAEATFAVNDAVLEPAGIVTVPGTITALLVLASAIARALDALALKVAVHAVFPAPVNEVFTHESEFN
jgi:hypothetical protein